MIDTPIAGWENITQVVTGGAPLLQTKLLQLRPAKPRVCLFKVGLAQTADPALTRTNMFSLVPISSQTPPDCAVSVQVESSLDSRLERSDFAAP